jgi:hypothetical protein
VYDREEARQDRRDAMDEAKQDAKWDQPTQSDANEGEGTNPRRRR